MLGWELPPHNSGGLGMACFSLTKSMSKMGIDIDFLVPYDAEHGISYMNVVSATKLDPFYRYGAGSYCTDPSSKKVFEGEDAKALSMRDIQKRYIKFVDRYLMDHTADVCHAHDWLTYEAGILAKQKYGIPLIAHVHATEFDRAGSERGNPLIHEIEYAGLLAADKILAVSQGTKDIIVQRYGIPAEKIFVCYNGFDPDIFADDYVYDGSVCKYLDALRHEGNTIVMTIGRLTVQKGLTYYLNAARKAISMNEKMVFVVAGDGEQRDELLRMSADLGIAEKVVFTGFVRGRELRDIYSVSDIFVMSSVSEPFGLTALEAAHHGNALVLTKQSGVGEILWSAMKYDFWDEDKLANELVAISESPALKGSLGRAAAREYRRMTWEVVAQKCIDVYHLCEQHINDNESEGK